MGLCLAVRLLGAKMLNNQISADEAAELAAACYANPMLFNKTFLSHWFFLPMPWVHRGMLAILSKKCDWLLEFGEEEWPKGKGLWTPAGLDKIERHFTWSPDPSDPKCPKEKLFLVERDSKGNPGEIHLRLSSRLLFIMPRGISKTTLVNSNNIYEIEYKDANFIVYLSETATHAEEQLGNVKREIESNEGLLLVFGNKKPERTEGKPWSQDFIETTDGMMIAAKGRGGQVRGMNHNGQRPTRIIFDDVEDKESVKTEDQRKKVRNWLKADVEPALPQIGDDVGEMIGMGTVLDEDCLIMNLARDPEWTTVHFGAKDPDGDMLWNSYLTEAQYNKKRSSFIRLGQKREFRMEYDSTAKPEDKDAKFKAEFIRYEPRKLSDCIARAIVIDPAISEKKGSDFCSFGVVGITERGIIHVYECYMEVGLSPRQQIDKYFELHFLYECTRHGVEAVAYQKALAHLLREEMFRKAKQFGPKAYFEIDEITHGNTGKIERVEGILSPRYAAGYVTHQRRFPDLEEQLVDWPNAKKDGPDVIAMAVALLDPYAAFAMDGDDDGTDQLAKDHYQPLSVELGNYRRAP